MRRFINFVAVFVLLGAAFLLGSALFDWVLSFIGSIGCVILFGLFIGALAWSFTRPSKKDSDA